MNRDLYVVKIVLPARLLGRKDSSTSKLLMAKPQYIFGHLMCWSVTLFPVVSSTECSCLVFVFEVFCCLEILVVGKQYTRICLLEAILEY